MKERIVWAVVGFSLGATATSIIYITLLRR
jgi:hypothetical protein